LSNERFSELSKKNTRRLVAGASTAALAAGFAASFGVGAASAAPVNQSTTSGQWTFNRTISNGTPAPGETITVTNDIRFNGGLAPTISALKDIHAACLTYVANSSRVEGSGVGTTTPDATTVSMNGSWIRSAVNRNISYTVQYTVGANCARDAALTTGAAVSANQSLSTTNATAGPSVSVAKDATQTTLTVGPAPQATKVSTLTATVSAGATGTVEFADNGTVLGTGTINNGTATYSWTPSAAQPYSITAKYLGDATHAQSTSAPQTGTVTPAPTAPGAPTDLAANPATVTAGGTVTITGKAEANSNVTVTAGNKTCTATADGAGNFACDIVTDAAGTLTVTAVAANNVGASPASAPITVEVTEVQSGTAVISVAPAALTAGTEATITVTGADAGTPVTVKVGTTTVCTTTVAADGTASCQWIPAAGAQTLTAEVVVDGTATTVTKAVTVAPEGNPGDGAGSLSNLFGS